MAEPEPIPLEDLITIKAAAEMIGCAAGSVKRYFLNGKLRRYKVGGGTRLSRQEIERVFPTRPTILQNGDLIPVQQAAELLSVRTQTLYRWVRDSKLQGVRVGLHSYVYRSELERLVLGLMANQSPIPGQFVKTGGNLLKKADPSLEVMPLVKSARISAANNPPQPGGDSQARSAAAGQLVLE